MSRFNIVRKGYDIKQVDEYVNNLALKDRESVADKSIRISELTEEINKLKGELMEYKNREASVNNALMVAVEKANEIEKMARLQCDIELERIKTYRDKWISYCDSVKVAGGIKERKSEVVSVLKHLEDDFRKSFDVGIKLKTKEDVSDAEMQYQDEVDRLLNKEKENQKKEIKVKKEDGLTAIDEHVLEESEVDRLIANPEFEALCKKLGLV